MDSLTAEGLAPRTWNYYLGLLREMFTRHEPGSTACRYFQETEEKDEDTKHRKPFTEEQLVKIYKAAEHDDFIRPIIVLGINTPLRLGDCCKLRWKAVELPNEYLTVKTSKTGESVQIPIWEQLLEELKKLPRTSEYVLPGQAQMYFADATQINSRLRVVFAAAGIKVYEKPQKPEKADAEAQVDEPETDQTADQNQTPDKNKQTAKGPRTVNESAFQAFRVTWVTRALNRKVPEEIVRKVTGHQAVEIVREHYYKPAKEELRQHLEEAKPDFYQPAKRPGTKMAEILKAMTAKTWKKDRVLLLKLLEEPAPTTTSEPNAKNRSNQQRRGIV